MKLNETVVQKAVWFALKTAHVPYHLKDDASQEAYLGIEKAMLTYDGRTQLSTYLGLKATWSVRTFLRSWDHLSRRHRSKVTQEKELAPLRVTFKEVPPAPPTQVDVTFKGELNKLLNHPNILTDFERLIILEHFFNECPLYELAAKLNRSTSVVYKFKNRALGKLRGLLV